MTTDGDERHGDEEAEQRSAPPGSTRSAPEGPWSCAVECGGRTGTRQETRLPALTRSKLVPGDSRSHSRCRRAGSRRYGRALHGRVRARRGWDGPRLPGVRPGRGDDRPQARPARARRGEHVPTPLRARGADGRAHRPSPRGARARQRRARRRALHGPAVHQGRLASGAPGARGGARARGRRHPLPAGGQGARSAPCPRADPPRPQAGEHPAGRARLCLRGRLRPDQGPPGQPDHPAGAGGRIARLHGARADPRRGGQPRRRRLLARLRDARMPVRAAAVRRPGGDPGPVGPSARRSAGPLRGTARTCPRTCRGPYSAPSRRTRPSGPPTATAYARMVQAAAGVPPLSPGRDR